MALAPFRRSNIDIFDPFSWDPFLSSPFSFAAEALHPHSHSSAVGNLQVDWKETPQAHIFKADLPGLKKKDIKVEVEDGRVLSIRGERLKEKGEESDTWHCAERSQGSFLRKFSLPENIKQEKMKATMENGVLTVTIPKAKNSKREVRTVPIA